MKTIYLFLGISYICHLTKGCDLELAPVAVIVSGTAEFRFNPVPPGDSVTYLVLRGSEPPKLIVSYTFDTPDPVQVATGITFTGDEATGNISLRFANVQLSDNGTYDLKDSTPKILQCIVLHLLGKPTVSLSKDQDPKVGDSVEFTCDADSTTVPSPAPYGFIFSWTFGSVTDPTGARYTKVGNKFKISQVGKDDEGKTVTCKATENVTNGITSDPSSSVSFTVTVDNNTSDLGAIIGGTVGAAAVLGICCGGAVMYGRNTTPNKPRGCRYNSTTKILKWERPKELPVLPTKNVTKYHIEIEMGLLTPEEIEHLRNTNGKLNNQGWLDITKEDATKDKDQQEDPQKDPQTSCQIDGLTAGKEYNFRVYAENGNGLSSAAYSKTGGNVDSGDSACCGRNNSILPICTGGDQHPSDGNKQKISHRPRHRDADTRHPGEPNSKTTKTDESGSFVSGKDIKVDTGGSSSFRAQPLPDIKSEKKNTRGLSANIDDSDINNPSYEKKRLTPIGQESHPGWEEKTDRSEDGKEKKKKRKSKDKDKERDSNVTESADL